MENEGLQEVYGKLEVSRAEPGGGRRWGCHGGTSCRERGDACFSEQLAHPLGQSDPRDLGRDGNPHRVTVAGLTVRCQEPMAKPNTFSPTALSPVGQQWLMSC